MIIKASALQLRKSRGEHFLLIDVRDAAEWQAGTLPGAQHCNVYDYFIADSTPAGLSAMAADAAAALRPLFDRYPAATPVFFEQQVGMRSPRGAWFSWLLGRDDALILDGGLDAWLETGDNLESGKGLSYTVTQNSEHAVVSWDSRWVSSRQQIINADGKTVINVDARRPSEFDGSFVHDCCHRAGRIPHSRLLFWEDVLENGRFRPAEDIARRAEAAGLARGAQLQVYCHRGARAATLLAALKLAGYPQVAIYVGSWHEWADHDELPVG